MPDPDRSFQPLGRYGETPLPEPKGAFEAIGIGYSEQDQDAARRLQEDAQRANERAQVEREAWRAAGLGFWRLVWIVALGILIAGSISEGIALLFNAVMSAR